MLLELVILVQLLFGVRAGVMLLYLVTLFVVRAGPQQATLQLQCGPLQALMLLELVTLVQWQRGPRQAAMPLDLATLRVARAGPPRAMVQMQLGRPQVAMLLKLVPPVVRAGAQSARVQ